MVEFATPRRMDIWPPEYITAPYAAVLAVFSRSMPPLRTTMFFATELSHILSNPDRPLPLNVMPTATVLSRITAVAAALSPQMTPPETTALSIAEMRQSPLTVAFSTVMPSPKVIR